MKCGKLLLKCCRFINFITSTTLNLYSYSVHWTVSTSYTLRVIKWNIYKQLHHFLFSLLYNIPQFSCQLKLLCWNKIYVRLCVQILILLWLVNSVWLGSLRRSLASLLHPAADLVCWPTSRAKAVNSEAAVISRSTTWRLLHSLTLNIHLLQAGVEPGTLLHLMIISPSRNMSYLQDSKIYIYIQ